LLRNVQVSRFVAEHSRKHCQKAEITAERVLAELAKLAFFDPRKLYNEDGSLKKVTELDDETAACIAGMDEEKLYENFGKGQAKPTGTIKKIKFADKGQNLERLGRYLKLFTEKHELEFKNLSQMTDDQLIELAGRLGVGADIAAAGSA
jgi:phage terminase small subunit